MFDEPILIFLEALLKVDTRIVKFTLGILSFSIVLAAIIMVSTQRREVAPPVGYPGMLHQPPHTGKALIMVRAEESLPLVGVKYVGEQERGVDNDQTAEAPMIEPYRTFITIQRYQINNNGKGVDSISNVKLQIKFPGQVDADGKIKTQDVELPGNGEYWPIGNGQVQEIDRTFELPYKYIENDGFKFEVHMLPKGNSIDPCKFEVVTLSQFNRAYICRTDVEWQRKKRIAEDKLDEESFYVRVFTDRLDSGTTKKDIPTNAIAIR